METTWYYYQKRDTSDMSTRVEVWLDERGWRTPQDFKVIYDFEWYINSRRSTWQGWPRDVSKNEDNNYMWWSCFLDAIQGDKFGICGGKLERVGACSDFIELGYDNEIEEMVVYLVELDIMGVFAVMIYNNVIEVVNRFLQGTTHFDVVLDILTE